MIDVSAFTKRYGDVTAVDDLSFTTKPGIITGFLGPNGAGKTTTMRAIVGLDHPTSGAVTINGQPYSSLKEPLRVVGSLLDAKAVHPNRSARNHLKWMAISNGIPTSRVDEVLNLVGLTDVAKKKAGGFSLGMGQRLGLASALLGDPEYLILDEPVNGLDPEGIRWVRQLLRALANEGKTILVSSHLLSEMANTADHLVVIGRGKLIADCPVDEFISGSAQKSVVVRTPHPAELMAALREEGFTVSSHEDKEKPPYLLVEDATTDEVGALAFSVGVLLNELTQQQGSLEDAFMKTTGDSVQYHSFISTGDAVATDRGTGFTSDSATAAADIKEEK